LKYSKHLLLEILNLTFYFICNWQAALGTAAKYWLNLYAVEKRGPVYPPMFSTLSAVFIIILGTLLLGESLTIGR
jgi:drug/metabolite transporter (DMT)-like permease